MFILNTSLISYPARNSNISGDIFRSSILLWVEASKNKESETVLVQGFSEDIELGTEGR